MMKRKVFLLLALSLLTLSAACAAKRSDQNEAYSMAAPAAEVPMMTAESVAYDSASYAAMEESGSTAAQGNVGADNAADAATRKIVYDANLHMTADDPAKALETIIARTTLLGGYLADSYTSNDDLGAFRCTATLKVPADELTALVAAAKALGRVDDYQLSSDDITRSYYDVAARLSSAQAEEKQLLEILARCETVEEILAVRESLARVRADIESYQTQINLWDNLVSYATLNLSVNRTPQPEVAREKELLTIWKASDVWNRMSRGFVNSARFVVNAVSAVGIFLAVALIPAAALFLLVGLPIILVRKNRRAKAAANGEPLPLSKHELRRAKKRAKGKATGIADPTAADANKPGADEPAADDKK